MPAFGLSDHLSASRRPRCRGNKTAIASTSYPNGGLFSSLYLPRPADAAPACKSAKGPNADRRRNYLTTLALARSFPGACSHLARANNIPTAWQTDIGFSKNGKGAACSGGGEGFS
jgi:hypothetical protein